LGKRGTPQQKKSIIKKRGEKGEIGRPKGRRAEKREELEKKRETNPPPGSEKKKQPPGQQGKEIPKRKEGEKTKSGVVNGWFGGESK